MVQPLILCAPRSINNNPLAAIVLDGSHGKSFVILVLDLFLRLAETIFQRPRRKVGLFLIDQQWR